MEDVSTDNSESGTCVNLDNFVTSALYQTNTAPANIMANTVFQHIQGVKKNKVLINSIKQRKTNIDSSSK